MTVARLEKGMFAEKEVETDASMAADRFHEKSPKVLSTASLIGIMQSVCADVMAPFLGSNEMVVSIRVEMSHIAAVPVGTCVKLTTRIVEVQDRQIIFSVEASDRGQTIASGKNNMFIIDKDRFEKGIERYKSSMGREQ